MTARAALTLVVAVSGCNYIFGLDPVHQLPVIDAPDARPGIARLTWWQSQSTPYDHFDFPAIDGAKVQIGDLDGALVDTPLAADGSFEIRQPPGQPYRLVYSVPNDPVPHEMQWSFIDGIHLTVPMFGRLPQTGLPQGAGFRLSDAANKYPCQPSPPAPVCLQQRTALTVFTTGTWMYGQALYNPSKTPYPEITLDATALAGYGGTTDNLSAAAGDIATFVHYTDSPIATLKWSADAFFVLSKQDTHLQAGAYTTPASPNWDDGADPAVNVRLQLQQFPSDSATALMSAYGALHPAVPIASEATAGAMANLSMPQMSLPLREGFDGVLVMPLQHQIAWSNACYTHIDPFRFSLLPAADDRPLGVVYRQYLSRTALPAGGPSLSTGFQAVNGELLADPGCPSTGPQVPPPIAIRVPLATDATFSVPLTHDQTPITLAHGALQSLTFNLADATNTSDCTVTLYRVVDPVLVAVRTITVPAKTGMIEVHVPTDDFQAGATHVFRIACRDGFPGAATGDYSTFAGIPQVESQAYPGTFVVTFQ